MIVDFLSGWIVSLLAIALYVGQTLIHAQLAERLQNSQTLRSQIAAASIGLLIYASQRLIRWGFSERNWWELGFGVLGLVFFGLPVFSC